MRLAVMILACASAIWLAIATQPAFAFCSKPIMPHCVADGTLSDSYVSTADCRADVGDHLEGLKAYQDCLEDLAEQTDKEIIRLQRLIKGASSNPPS